MCVIIFRWMSCSIPTYWHCMLLHYFHRYWSIKIQSDTKRLVSDGHHWTHDWTNSSPFVLGTAFPYGLEQPVSYGDCSVKMHARAKLCLACGTVDSGKGPVHCHRAHQQFVTCSCPLARATWWQKEATHPIKPYIVVHTVTSLKPDVSRWYCVQIFFSSQ